EVTATFSSDCHWVTIEPEEVELDTIESGNDANTDENLRITLDPDCPGATVVTISVEIRSGEQMWPASFEITTAGPLLLSNSDMIDVEDFIPGGIAAVIPTVQNIGNVEVGVIIANLVSLDDMIEVTQPNRRYRSLGANESAGPNQPFYVRIDPFFVPGNNAMFELILSEDDEDGFDTTLTLSKRVSSEEEGYPFGPSEYGYYCFDSGDENWDIAPIYNWREINPDVENNEFAGTKLDPVEIDTIDQYWDNTEVVDLPFAFTYFGETFEESITVSYNGWMAMGSDAEEFHTSKNQPIPGIGNPDGQICILWQDILNNDTRLPYQGVYTYYIEEEGIFVIEWSDVEVEVGVEDNNVIYAPLNFQILLFDSEVFPTPTEDNEIVFQYKEFQAVAGYSGNFEEDVYQYATIGIRNLDDSGGIQYAYRNEYLPQAHPVENEFAIKFTTTVGYDRGAVSGRVVRSEDANTGIEGVIVSHPLIPSDTTDAQGYFQIEDLRVGRYDEMALIGEGFNVNTVSFNITPAETTDVGVISLTHPEISLLFYPFVFDSLSLQPDNQIDSAVVEISNSGNGPLNYKMDVVYYDGRETEFANIESIPAGTILDERVKGVEFVDSLWYVSAGRNTAGRIYVLNRDGQEVRSFAPTVDGETFPFYSLSWDGDSHFWGSCRNADADEGRIARFAMADGAADITLNSPFDDIVINQLSITYSPDRGTIFASDLNTGIVELTTDGEEVQRLEFSIPGGGYETSGLGWNRYDVTGKSLYIFSVNFEEVRRKLIRMDPETGDWEIFGDDLGGYEGPDGVGAYFGMAVMHDYEDSLSAIAVSEYVNDGILRTYEIGPNVSFLVGGNVSNPVGSVNPEEAAISVMSLDATELLEGTYRFALKMTHNDVGGETLIPVTLIVDENSGVDFQTDMVPLSFDLNTIYPNPFNAVSRIRFTVDAVRPTTLTVYDLSGRKIATLYDNVANVGVHQVLWDASELPSGIYFVRLQAGNMSKTAKAAVMK
ncbi:MAG: T9SS type A sorting domain-containing protein, partial [Candidatus Electryoneaceae bacterium]|nr:T9SS type A sorting domain-containing protein [Candidatus Electryoneaceae bacterium]